LARLQYLADRGTLGLVLGASGLGKSALVKRFLHKVRDPACRPVHLHLPRLSSKGLLTLLVTALRETLSRGKRTAVHPDRRPDTLHRRLPAGRARRDPHAGRRFPHRPVAVG